MGHACAIGLGDREASCAVEAEMPSAFVREVMMFAAEGQHVAHVGCTAVAPVADVMQCAIVEGHIATVDGTTAVHHAHRSPLMGCRKSLGPPEVKDDAVRPEHPRNDVGQTCLASNGLNRQRDAIGDFDTTLGVHTIEQGVEVDDDRDIGPPGARTFPLDQPQQRKRSEVILLSFVERAGVRNSIMKERLDGVAKAP